jgi:hypothetical protein
MGRKSSQLSFTRVIFYPRQFEWILHHTNLESLSLIACPILIHVETDHPTDCPNCKPFDSTIFEGEITTSKLGVHVWRNSLRWTTWLNRFREELGQLKEFRMCGGHSNETHTCPNWSRADRVNWENEMGDEDEAYELSSETFEDNELDSEVDADNLEFMEDFVILRVSDRMPMVIITVINVVTSYS